MNITFVLPTKNEEASIEIIVGQLRDQCRALNINLVEIILVDDSTDNTRDIGRNLGLTVLNGGGVGLGYAMWKGLKKASLNMSCDFIVTLDADGQSDIGELNMFLLPLKNEASDLVLGSRFLQKGLVKYPYPIVNRFGVLVLSRILKWVTGLPITDSHGGMRAMRRVVAEELEMFGTHSYVQETIIDANEKGFRVTEVPSIWKVRKSGTSRVVRSIPLYICYILPILIIRAKYHIKLFFTFGLLFILSSLAHITYVSIETQFSFEQILERQSLHLTLLLFLVGISMFFFGITLEFVSRILRTVNNGVDLEKL